MNRVNFLHVVLTCAVTVLAIGLAGCDQSGPEEAVVRIGEEAPRAARSTQPLVTLPPPFGEHDGESTLTRTSNGASYRFSTTNLNPGHAYTLWFVAFNAPGACANSAGCTPGDLFNPATASDMMYGGGHVVGGPGQASSSGRTDDRTGQVTFSGRVKVGDASGSAMEPIGMPATGLTAPFGAEIHLVLRDHGPKISELMPDMITTLAGGCTDAAQGAGSPWNVLTASPDYADEFGRLGPNTCESVLLSVHQP